MKLLEKAVLEPAYQGIMHSNPDRLDNNRRNETTDNIFSSPLFFRLYNELKHLCRRIGVIRVLSTHTAPGEIFHHQSAPPRGTLIFPMIIRRIKILRSYLMTYECRGSEQNHHPGIMPTSPSTA